MVIQLEFGGKDVDGGEGNSVVIGRGFYELRQLRIIGSII